MQAVHHEMVTKVMDDRWSYMAEIQLVIWLWSLAYACVGIVGSPAADWQIGALFVFVQCEVSLH